MLRMYAPPSGRSFLTGFELIMELSEMEIINGSILYHFVRT